jgi:hypothetical protein
LIAFLTNSPGCAIAPDAGVAADGRVMVTAPATLTWMNEIFGSMLNVPAEVMARIFCCGR